MKKQILLSLVASQLFITNAAFAQAVPRCEIHFISAAKTDSTVQSNEQINIGEKLAVLLEADAELSSIIRQPEAIMYIYLRFFEEGSDRELAETLGKIAIIDGKSDLYDIFTKKIATKLKDENIRGKIDELFSTSNIKDKKPEQVSRRQKIYRQLKALPETVSRMKKIIKTDLAIAKMDRGFFDIYGALKLGLKESSLRRWDAVPGSFGAVHPSQIKNMDPVTWAHVAVFGSEIEAGIDGYSRQSGEMFRAFLPNLSLFSGKTVEQHEKQSASDRGFCTNVWCFEENRHTGMLRTLYRQLTGLNPPAENPSEAYHELDPFNLDHVFYHMASRNATEWNAISGYTMMGSHAEGPTYAWIKNIREDEIKHMAIFSAAYKFVFGTNLKQRLQMMIKKVRTELNYESGKSEYGSASSSNPAILTEAGIAHVLVEVQVRKYISSLPLKTLRKFFTFTPGVPTPASNPVALEKQQKIDEMLNRETRLINDLARWNKNESKEAKALEAFEKEHEQLVVSLIKNMYKNYNELLDYDSEAATEFRNSIEKLSKGSLETSIFIAKYPGFQNDLAALRTFDYTQFKLLKKSLLETLRDYQIVNNSMVREKGLRVVLKSLQHGYEVEMPNH